MQGLERKKNSNIQNFFSKIRSKWLSVTIYIYLYIHAYLHTGMHPCIHSYMHYIMKAATDPNSGPTLWPSVNVLLPRSVANKVIIHGRRPVHQEVESIPRGTWAALMCRLQKQTAHFKNHLVHWSLGPQRPTISNCLAFTFRIFSDLFGSFRQLPGLKEFGGLQPRQKPLYHPSCHLFL